MEDVAQLIEALQLTNAKHPVYVYDQGTGHQYRMIGIGQMHESPFNPDFEPFVVITIDSVQVPGKPIEEWHPMHKFKVEMRKDADANSSDIRNDQPNGGTPTG